MVDDDKKVCKCVYVCIWGLKCLQEDARKWEHVDRTAASVLQQLLDVTYSGLLLQVFNFPLLLDMRFVWMWAVLLCEEIGRGECIL